MNGSIHTTFSGSECGRTKENTYICTPKTEPTLRQRPFLPLPPVCVHAPWLGRDGYAERGNHIHLQEQQNKTMSKTFTEHTKFDLTAVNMEVLAKWDKMDLFHRSISERTNCPPYVFFEGPPSANGHPGIHHVMARTIKDTFCRYKTMQGFQVHRKAGWDTHGLPVELGVEKELGITKEDIGRKVSVEDYNRKCRENVMMYTREWTDLSYRMGYWVDMEHPYVTYENSYIESLWWLLRQLYDKGLLYKGYTIQPYSPGAGTGLSSHELNQPGCYRDVKDTTVTAQFRVTDTTDHLFANPEALPVCLLAWTTTPWTLPSNTALCVGPQITYVALQGTNPFSGENAIYILAESRVGAYFKVSEDEELRILARFSGKTLEGLHYRQLMPWIEPVALAADGTFEGRGADAFRVIPGDYVTTEDGTGIVHIAPTFGADDAKVARDAGIPSLFVIDRNGDTRPMVDFTGRYFVREDMDPAFAQRFVHDAYWAHSGKYVKNAYDPRYNVQGVYDAKAAQKDPDLNVALCVDMKAQGTAFSIEKHVHTYPHCWRTDKPVLYYPLDSWFIRSTAAKERMAELNRNILWKPESTGTGRFGKWLENLNDWNLSRSRYWGTPLPIWRNRETREEVCIGSIQELWDEIEKAVTAGIMAVNPLREKGFVPGDYSAENYRRIDLHRPYVDQIVLVSKSGAPLHRETDLIDVWFDSGSMPYAQLHYPFENAEEIDHRTSFPADFIAEGVDQTRGWFFTLHAIATMVFDSVAFKAVISNGLVLDKNGQKMSKRLGNAVNPFDTIEAYGSDPLRWYMVTHSAPWDNLAFDPEGVRETTGTFFAKLYQLYNMLAMFANIDGWTPETAGTCAEPTRMDRWITSRLHSLTNEVTAAFEAYEPTRAGRAIQAFVVDDLSNWYVRLCKKRLWGEGLSPDKLTAYRTLYNCLLTVSRLMAPIAPFYADRIYTDLQGPADSVHLDTFPKTDNENILPELEHQMQLAQEVTSLVHAIRKKEKIGVRQPLQNIAIPVTNVQTQKDIQTLQALILEEVNVKNIDFVGGQMVRKTVKPNFRVMGKKFGKQMKEVAAAVAALQQEAIAELEGGSTLINVAGKAYKLTPEDVIIVAENLPGWSVASDGTLTVALDITITPELRLEGQARDIVRSVQNLRKDTGLEITDRIRLTLPESTRKAAEAYAAYICGQVLAVELNFGPNETPVIQKA